MSSQKINYHFALIKSKVNSKGLSPIYLRLILNKKRINVSTSYFVKEEDWINKNGTYTTNKSINNGLDRLIERLENISFEINYSNEDISLQDLKNRLIKQVKPQEKKTILTSFRIHNEDMESLINYKYSFGTYKNYKTTLKYLVEFVPMQYKAVDLPLEKLNFEFLKKYELFLLKNKACTNNGVMKQIQRIKKVVHFAMDNEWITKDNTTRYKIQYEKTDRGYLTENELKKIEEIELNESLSNVRDYFLFSCYTGISYVDIKTLKHEHIQQDDKGNDWIIQTRGKTNVQAMIPLLSKAKKVLVKHQKVGTEFIFKVISNQKTNKYLKEIALLAKVNKRVSFHLARHTFATTVTLTKGVPIETVSKMLGHNKISTTQIYSRVLKEKILADVSKFLKE